MQTQRIFGDLVRDSPKVILPTGSRSGVRSALEIEPDVADAQNEQSETGEHYRRQWQEREIEGRILLRNCGTLGWNLAGAAR